MAGGFHYAQQGKQAGPVSVDELRNMLRTGQLAPTDLVWTSGMADWRPASEVPELQPPIAPAATAPLSPSPLAGQALPAPQSSSPVAPNVTPSASPALSVADRIKHLLASLVQTASATSKHIGRLAACGMAKAKIPAAQRAALASQAALGQRMYAAGLGGEAPRRLVNELTERIASLQAARTSTRAVQVELNAACAALAAPALESNLPPPGTETEFEAARAARASMAEAQTAVETAHSQMRSIRAQQGTRIGIGYGCIVLLLATVTWAGLGSGNANPNADGTPRGDNGTPRKDPPSDDRGGADDDVVVNPTEPVQPDTPYVPVDVQPPSDQKTTCFNCNGTGQANCTACFGRGTRTCFNCNGSGRTVNNMQCFQCNGTGQQRCLTGACNYGKVQCPQCFGTGQK